MTAMLAAAAPPLTLAWAASRLAAPLRTPAVRSDLRSNGLTALCNHCRVQRICAGKSLLVVCSTIEVVGRSIRVPRRRRMP